MSDPLDPPTARRLIKRLERFPLAIGVMFTTDAACPPKMFFQWRRIKITSDDRGTPVKIKRKLEEIYALGEEVGIAAEAQDREDAGMPAEAQDRAHALRYLLSRLYDNSPQYFSVAEDVFEMRNFPVASIEYLQGYAFSKPGRPKRRASAEPRRGRGSSVEVDGSTFDAKNLRDDLTQSVFAMNCDVSRSTIQRLESGSPLSPKISKKIREAAQSTLDNPEATTQEKAQAQEMLKSLGATTTRPRR